MASATIGEETTACGTSCAVGAIVDDGADGTLDPVDTSGVVVVDTDHGAPEVVDAMTGGCDGGDTVRGATGGPATNGSTSTPAGAAVDDSANGTADAADTSSVAVVDIGRAASDADAEAGGRGTTGWADVTRGVAELASGLAGPAGWAPSVTTRVAWGRDTPEGERRRPASLTVVAGDGAAEGVTCPVDLDGVPLLVGRSGSTAEVDVLSDGNEVSDGAVVEASGASIAGGNGCAAGAEIGSTRVVSGSGAGTRDADAASADRVIGAVGTSGSAPAARVTITPSRACHTCPTVVAGTTGIDWGAAPPCDAEKDGDVFEGCATESMIASGESGGVPTEATTGVDVQPAVDISSADCGADTGDTHATAAGTGTAPEARSGGASDSEDGGADLGRSVVTPSSVTGGPPEAGPAIAVRTSEPDGDTGTVISRVADSATRSVWVVRVWTGGATRLVAAYRTGAAANRAEIPDCNVGLSFSGDGATCASDT